MARRHSFVAVLGLVVVVAAGTVSVRAGVIQAPDYYVGERLASGALVELLKKHRPPPEPISIVYPTSRQAPARLRALAERLAGLGRSGPPR